MTMHDPNEPKPNDAARMLSYRTQPLDAPNYAALGRTLLGFFLGMIVACVISNVVLALLYLILNQETNIEDRLVDIATPLCFMIPASALVLVTLLLVRMHVAKGGEFVGAGTAILCGICYFMSIEVVTVLSRWISLLSIISCMLYIFWVPGFPIVAAYIFYRPRNVIG